MTQDRYAIGVDIGGTTFELALVSAKGAVSLREEHETRQFVGSDDMLAFVGQRAQAIAKKSRQPVAAAGIGLPGTVRADGMLDFAPNLPGVWKRVDVKTLLQKASSLLAFPLNDANAAALGEFHFGAGKKANSLVLFTLGTGIGGGIVIDGKLLLGSHGRAAEVGHTTVELNGPRCGCGNHGCLEALSAVPAMVTRTFAKLQQGRKSVIAELVKGDYAQIDRERIGLLLSAALKRKDVVAQEVVEETAAVLAAAIETAVMMIDPDMVILGGGIAKIGEPLFAPIRRAVAARTPEIPFDVTKIVPAKLDNGGLVGAAAWALENEKVKSEA